MNNTYYQEKLESLPDNLQYAIMMSEWQERLVEIQQKFKLHIDQTQVLEDSTIKLMFGDIDASDFINHMFNDAHINSELAADILLEVDLQILKRVREKLELIQESEGDDEEVEKFLLTDEERVARDEADKYAEYYSEVAKIRQEDDLGLEDAESMSEGEIPADVEKEKDDLLNEINEPTKSFTLENTYKPTPQPEPIPVDHQLENTHVEEPFHEEDIIPETPKAPEPTPAPTPQAPEIKKPISIKLDDIYREPIE